MSSPEHIHLPSAAIEDQFTPLPSKAVQFQGYLEDYLQNSLIHWNKGVVPYAAFVQMFRTGRQFFAEGEMWGKAVRSGAMFYRYTQDPDLKVLLQKTVADLLTTKRSNGSISCSDIPKQPEGKQGDLWERKYVLLGLDGYYEQVEQDSAVLQAMIDEADCTIAQIGSPPKVGITDEGWSPNHIESSTILEPIVRLYKRTGYQRYLDFATYIIRQGGAKGYNVIDQSYQNMDPEKIGGPYPKAYEMMSLFEGVLEYYRVTGKDYYKQSVLNLFHNIGREEITIVGNGGGDQPYHPSVLGEAWDYTALEQTNPKINREMETCAGVTWLKLCSQVCRLTGDPAAIDAIEKYAYNGLIGAMKPEGDGFSYVNKLNGVKTNPMGWGGKIGGVYVTCCNLNGPMGLAYLPYVAVMNSKTGPVVNLYNSGTASFTTTGGQNAVLTIKGQYPVTGDIALNVMLEKPESFTIRLRIPAWSNVTKLTVNGTTVQATPGTYTELNRLWSSGDTINLTMDMSCRVVPAPHGSNPAGNNFIALIRGPIVLVRDENIDPDYNKPVSIQARDGIVELTPVATTLPTTKMQFTVPTSDGNSIQVVDYSTVNSWKGKQICSWLPTAGA